jgi:hypothetical protein
LAWAALSALSLTPEAVEVEGGNLLVEVLGQNVDFVLVLAVVGVELDLGQHLDGEGGAHHKARVTGSAAEINEPPFGQYDQPLAAGKTTSSTCGLTSSQG